MKGLERATERPGASYEGAASPTSARIEISEADQMFKRSR